MKKVKNGFSLIELLVVVSIIGILVAISFSAFTQTKKNARDLKRKSDLEQIRSSLEIYRTDCKTYPAALGTSLIGPEDTPCAGETYLTLVPTDPISSTYQYYYHFKSANEYELCAYLETGSDSVDECGSNCNADGDQDCNYMITNP